MNLIQSKNYHIFSHIFFCIFLFILSFFYIFLLFHHVNDIFIIYFKFINKTFLYSFLLLLFIIIYYH
jgi:hypothetical protein